MVLKLVIDFTAAWCGPCKAMEPRVKEIASKYSEAVFARVDVDRLMVIITLFLLLKEESFYYFIVTELFGLYYRMWLGHIEL